MTKIILTRMFVGLLLMAALFGGSACSKVPAGYVGIKVYLLGSEKGVDHEELGVGRYWIGINEELYLFPTFQQNYVWTADETEGSPSDESITFQTVEGLAVNADFGISYKVNPQEVNKLFQEYRKGIDEVTDIFLRNMVRDALVTNASRMPIESVYGTGKEELLKRVNDLVREQMGQRGLILDRIYVIGQFRLPKQVETAINSKIEATQRAQQRENEVAEATAEANKRRAQALGEKDAAISKAQGEAESIRLVTEAITPAYIRYQALQKWNGAYPTYLQMGQNGSDTIIELPSISSEDK